MLQIVQNTAEIRWLGRRDSNPDTVVRRATHRLRSASIGVIPCSLPRHRLPPVSFDFHAVPRNVSHRVSAPRPLLMIGRCSHGLMCRACRADIAVNSGGNARLSFLKYRVARQTRVERRQRRRAGSPPCAGHPSTGSRLCSCPRRTTATTWPARWLPRIRRSLADLGSVPQSRDLSLSRALT